MIKTLASGYSFESMQQELSNEYQHLYNRDYSLSANNTISHVCIVRNRQTREIVLGGWAHLTVGPNEQSQHFGELRQKICLNTYTRECFNEVCQVWMVNSNVLTHKKVEKSVCQTPVIDYIDGFLKSLCPCPLDETSLSIERVKGGGGDGLIGF